MTDPTKTAEATIAAVFPHRRWTAGIARGSPVTAWADLCTADAVAAIRAKGWHVMAIGDTWTVSPPGTSVDANNAPLGKRGHKIEGGVAALVAFVAGWEAATVAAQT